MDSKSQKGQGVPEIEGVLEGEEGFLEGEPKINFEEEFCTGLEQYAVELDRDINVMPISKLV